VIHEGPRVEDRQVVHVVILARPAERGTTRRGGLSRGKCCKRSGEFGVVLIGVEVKNRRTRLIYGHLPVGPLHDPAVTLHEYGQVATASARALGLTQYYTSSLAGRPQGSLALSRQRLLRKRAAASLADRRCHHFFAIDPERQLGRPSEAWWQHTDLKPIEHPSTLGEYWPPQVRSYDWMRRLADYQSTPEGVAAALGPG
jgi:hypothetical protein